MPRDDFDYTHGDSGVEPTEALNFEANERPDAEHFDWWWNVVISKVNAIFSEFNRLDSDDDGVVDRADYADDADASTYKGNDIDSDGDGKVDNAVKADNSISYKNNDIDSDGDGVVNTADYANDADASTYKGNDIDSDGDGTVNNADEVNGHRITVSSSAPSNPDENDIWIDIS